MKNVGRFNLFIKLAVIAFVCFCIFTIVGLHFRYNELREEGNELNQRIENVKDDIEKIKSDLDAPFDDEYIIRVAREKLNYCLPEEIIFYSDR